MQLVVFFPFYKFKNKDVTRIRYRRGRVSYISRRAGVHARYISSKDHDNARSTLTDSTLSTEMECPICYDDFPAKTMLQMPCKHLFCPGCWTGTLTSMMDDRFICFRTTCPHSKCPEFITEDEVRSFAPQLLDEYRSIQLRSFADLDQTSRWCPGRDCECIATAAAHDRSGVVVTCDLRICRTSFCLKCGHKLGEIRDERRAEIRCWMRWCGDY